MAIGYEIYPGDNTIYTSGLHYAVFADAPLKVKSGETAQTNFLFKVEVLDTDGETLITSYRKPTSSDASYLYLELQLQTLLSGLMNLPEPELLTLSNWVNDEVGFLMHKIKVTEVYDNGSGVPTEYASTTNPAGTTVYMIAHNIAHENDPGMGSGTFMNMFLTNDAAGKFKQASFKQIFAWINPDSAFDTAIQLLCFKGSKLSVYYIKDEDGEIVVTVPDSGRIVIPVSKESFPVNDYDRIIMQFVPITTPVTPPNVPGIGINEPPIGTPSGGGFNVKVDLTTHSAHVATWKQGDIVTVTTTAGNTIYDGDFEIAEKIEADEFMLRGTYDASDATDVGSDFEVRQLGIYDDTEDALAVNCDWKGAHLCGNEALIYANSVGGLDVVDFISLDNQTVQSTGDKLRINEVKQRFGTRSAMIKELTTNWIDNYDIENVVGMMNSSKHWLRVDDILEQVLLQTDSIKVQERRDLISASVTVEMQDNLRNI